jgi:hypothetical protein
METRSQTNALLKKYEFIFDFDESSNAWRENKKSMGNGTYIYVCQKITNKNKKCDKKCLSGENYCKMHLTQLTNAHA